MAKKPFPFSVCEQCCVDGGGSGGTITLDTEMSDTSENAVQNKVIKKYVDDKNGFLIVNVTVNEDGTVTADKNAYDLREIHESGRQIILRHITMDTELSGIYDIYCMSHFFYDDDLGNVGFTFTNISGKTLKVIECYNDEWHHIYSYTYATTKDIGDIETALDSIIAIQNELIGGESV